MQKMYGRQLAPNVKSVIMSLDTTTAAQLTGMVGHLIYKNLFHFLSIIPHE